MHKIFSFRDFMREYLVGLDLSDWFVWMVSTWALYITDGKRINTSWNNFGFFLFFIFEREQNLLSIPYVSWSTIIPQNICHKFWSNKEKSMSFFIISQIDKAWTIIIYSRMDTVVPLIWYSCYTFMLHNFSEGKKKRWWTELKRSRETLKEE